MYEGCCHFLYPPEMAWQMVIKFTHVHVNVLLSCVCVSSCECEINQRCDEEEREEKEEIYNIFTEYIVMT